MFVSKKKRATTAFMEDFLLKTIPGNNEDFLYQIVPLLNNSTTLKTEEHL